MPSSTSLPHATRPTPPEPLVELFDTLTSTSKTTSVEQRPRVVLVCLSACDKLFLFTALLRHHRLHNHEQKSVLAVANEQQTRLWKAFFTTMTTLNVEPSEKGQEERCDKGLQAGSGSVQVLSHSDLLDHSSLDARLLIVDNGQLLLGHDDLRVIQECKGQVIIVVSSLIEPQSHLGVDRRGLKATLEVLSKRFHAQTDTTCHLLSSLTHAVKPTVHVIVYEEVVHGSSASSLDCESCLSFLEDHNFSLIDICGPDLEELVRAIPDPSIKPRQLLLSLLQVHNELGTWCTERAALLLLVMLERMRRREKYERHFLLLGVVATQVERVLHFLTHRRNTECKSSEEKEIADYQHNDHKHSIENSIESVEGEVNEQRGERQLDDESSLSDREECDGIQSKEAVSYSSKMNEERSVQDGTSVQMNKNVGLHNDDLEGSIIDESSRMLKSSHPKLLRLVEVLRSYKPLHVGRRGDHQSSTKQRHLDSLLDDNKPPWLISYDDPEALYGMICVETAFNAQILFHFIKELSRNDESFSFLSPQYYTEDEENEEVEYKKKRRKMEEALRKFRVKESNLLITNANLTSGLEQTRCNLIIAFDPPKNFSSYIHQKVRARGYAPLLIYFVSNKEKDEVMHQLASFKVIEDDLRLHCSLEEQEEKEPECDALLPVVNVKERMSITSSQAIFVLNRYCSKLPSDAFTRLVAKYETIKVGNEDSIDTQDCSPKTLYKTTIRLPISSPVRSVITGPLMPSKLLSRQCAALMALVTLNEMDELDHVMHSIRESKFISRRERMRANANHKDDASTSISTPGSKKEQKQRDREEGARPKNQEGEKSNDSEKQDMQQQGSLKRTNPTKTIEEHKPTSTEKEGPTSASSALPQRNPTSSSGNVNKRRPYYFKQISPHLTTKGSQREGQVKEDIDCIQAEDKDKEYYLYSISLRLNCPLPEEQNTRGRRLHSPELSSKSFGLLVSKLLPSIPSFPIYTRSGEVMVAFKLIKKLVTSDSLKNLETFHNYTFSDVLRLSKFPMIFCPQRSDNSGLVVPLNRTRDDIDVKFVNYIVDQKALGLKKPSDSEEFVFRRESFEDAVVLPWYRNLDQPQFYYVAEICPHLSPKADFPGQGFESFEKYYSTKYDIRISNLDQPLLDVDHTSQRLNFLTPRHVNRKGIALPTSSEETKRMKRENLDQKQILVPELCIIHPFPASLWRQAVTLPCIFYRLNSLLVAEGLRSSVAKEMGLGKVELPSEFQWEPLDFGWSLGDVVINKGDTINRSKKQLPLMKLEEETKIEIEEGSDLNKLSHDLVNKMNEEDKRLKQKSLEIGMWSNDMSFEETSRNKADEDDLDDDDLDPNVALPDNLILLGNNNEKSSKNSGNSASNRRDWGTGIAQKKFRVGSPTFFKNNPHINIPGAMSDDDDDSYVDDTSTDDDDDEDNNDDALSVASLRGESVSRIRFNNDNEAEAVDERNDQVKCDQWINQARANEAAMVEALPWTIDDDDDDDSRTFEIEVQAAMQRMHLMTIVTDETKSFERHPRAKSNLDETRPTQDDNTCSQDLKNQVEQLARKQNFAHQSHLNEVDINTTLTQKPLDEEREASPTNKAVMGSSKRVSKDISKTEFSFDFQPDLDSHIGPSPSLLLQALTMSNSNDAVNLERLETIGDSFLKYATTTYLFCENASVSEGQLSDMRSRIVSNFNLHRCGRRRLLGECMVASKFEPHDNWLPPCYYVPKAFEQALIESEVPASHLNTADLPPIDGLSEEQLYDLVRHKKAIMNSSNNNSNKSGNAVMPSFVPYNLLTQHKIPDKSIADCVEALIGAYLLSCGPRGAMIFMCYMGLQVLPKNRETHEPSMLRPPAAPSNPIPVCLESELSLFEAQLGYCFKNKALLLQALCHASFSGVRLTDCYQRLEFLGDAVLDYLITRHAFEDARRHSPGELTDLRSALVNNNIFATLAARNNFHVFYNHCAPTLDNVVHRFVALVKRHDEDRKESDTKVVKVEEEQEESVGRESQTCSTRLSPLVTGLVGDEVEEVEGPKWLADVFESVAGAVFVDSNLSLDAVWAVYEPIMRDEIEAFSKNVPKSAVRELLELEPETASFGKPEKLADGKRVRVKVSLMGKGVFYGIGRNYRLAKCSAAKCALRSIYKNKKPS